MSDAVLVVNARFPNLDAERAVLSAYRLVDARCRSADEVVAAAPDARGILITSTPQLTGGALRSLPELRVVCRYGMGVDNVDVDAATELGIAVCNVPDYAIDEVASHTLALTLALVRRVVDGVRVVAGGAWSMQSIGAIHDLGETVLGVAGFGLIGRRTAEKALGVGMRVLVHDPFVDDAEIAKAGAAPATWDDLLANADVLSLHVPLGPATRGMVDDAALSRMKPTAYLVNTARGALVDEAALVRALDAGTIAGAALDVLAEEPPGQAHPLLGRANVLITPHMAWYSEEARARLQRAAAEQVRTVLEGGVPPHQVNRMGLTGAA